MVFLLAFAHSVHAQPVPINSTVGYSENLYAKIFYPLMRKERMWLFKIVRSNRWKNSFFVHLHVRQLIQKNQPFYLPYLHSSCGGYNPPQFAALWPSHYHRRNYPLLVHRECLSKYIHCVFPSTVLLLSQP